jgi:hypothetical protein
MALVSFVAAFHLLLLGGRVVDGSVLNPAVAVEWVIGLMLLLGLLRLHRSGSSLVKGHGAVILWLLVLLLHAVAVAPGGAGSFDIELDKTLLAIGPISAAIGGVVIRLVERLLDRDVLTCTPVFRGAHKTTREVRLSSSDFLRALVPRGPPI